MCLNVVSTLERFSWQNENPPSCHPFHCNHLGPDHYHVFPGLWLEPPVHSPHFSHCPLHQQECFFKMLAFAQNLLMVSSLFQNKSQNVYTHPQGCRYSGPITSKFTSYISPNPQCSGPIGLSSLFFRHARLIPMLKSFTHLLECSF